MCCEHLQDVLHSRPKSNPRTCNSFAHKPIASEKGCWSSIERISPHGTLFNWPFGQYCQPAAKYATVIKLPIRQNFLRLLPDALIVFLCPTFLQSNDMGHGIRGPNSFPSFQQAFPPELGQVFQAPTVECDHVDLCRYRGVHDCSKFPCSCMHRKTNGRHRRLRNTPEEMKNTVSIIEFFMSSFSQYRPRSSLRPESLQLDGASCDSLAG